MWCFAAAHDTHEGGPVPPQGPSLRQKNRSPQLFCKRLSEERCFDNEILPQGNGLRYVRHTKVRPDTNNPG